MSVFGALNRFISRLDSDSPAQNTGAGHGAFGFQVLRNKNDEVPMEPWYDFVIGINGRQIVRSKCLQEPRAWIDFEAGQSRCQPLCYGGTQLCRLDGDLDLMEREGLPFQF